MNKYKKVKEHNFLKGEITIPADKSISHRAIMLSSIAEGKTIITNLSLGADSLTTLKLFKQLGIDIKFINENTIEVNGGKLICPNEYLNAGNSGTTMRLASGILASQKFESKIIGDASLSNRPMKRIIEPLTLMGAQIKSENGYAPLIIHGRELQGIDYVSKLSSAQVKSCVLLAGINANGMTSYVEPFLSRNHTEIMLKYLGADISITDKKIVIAPSNLISKNIDIVGDISSATFFIVAALIIKNSDIIIKNVGINPTRAGIIDIIKRMNGNIEIYNVREVSGELCADIRVQYCENLKSCEISGSDIPKLIDEIPIISILASQADGETIIKDAKDLRHKESDRISCLVKELKKLNIDVIELEDGLKIRGKANLKGDIVLETYNDHRLAMSFYIAGLLCKNEIAINNFEWINISFPEFELLINNLTNY